MLAVDAHSVAAPAIAGTLATSPRQGAVDTPTHTASHPLPADGCVSPAGICQVGTGFGDLTVSASFAFAVNTKATLSTGPITLGQFTSVTSTPTPASLTLPPLTPTDTPVITPEPTSTNTPAPTATPTAPPTITLTIVPRAVPSPTFTLTPRQASTPTAKPRLLRFSLDAARVAHPEN